MILMMGEAMHVWGRLGVCVGPLYLLLSSVNVKLL